MCEVPKVVVISTAVVLPGVTCHFVADEFGRLDVTDAAEQTAQLVLTHRLWQVVHDQVRPRVLVLHQLLGKAVIVQLLHAHTRSRTRSLSQLTQPIRLHSWILNIWMSL